MSVKDLFKIIEGNNLMQAKISLKTDSSFGEYSDFTKVIRSHEIMKSTFKDCIITKIEDITRETVSIVISSMKNFEYTDIKIKEFSNLLENVMGEHYVQNTIYVNDNSYNYGTFVNLLDEIIMNIWFIRPWSDWNLKITTKKIKEEINI